MILTVSTCPYHHRELCRSTHLVLRLPRRSVAPGLLIGSSFQEDRPEHLLSRAADWTLPVVRQVLEESPFRDLTFLVPSVRIVHVAAICRLTLPHLVWFGHLLVPRSPVTQVAVSHTCRLTVPKVGLLHPEDALQESSEHELLVTQDFHKPWRLQYSRAANSPSTGKTASGAWPGLRN